MPRLNVWVPDDLHRSIRTRLPGLNVSAVVQGALAAQLDCPHDHLTCASCSTPVDHRQLIDDASGRFYVRALEAIGNLARAGGTAEGAARVLKDQGERHQITAATRMPLPRPTRAQRVANKVTPLPTEVASRRRHPTARSKTA